MQQDLGIENNMLVILMGLPFCDNLIFILQFNMINKQIFDFSHKNVNNKTYQTNENEIKV